MKRALLTITSLALLLLISLHAQDLPAFEAASIKESRGLLPTPTPFAPDRFNRSNITLSLILVYAYEVSEFQIEGGPDWVRTRRFDIEAKADRIRPVGEMRLTVRRLLADRFGLKVRLETQERPRYALVFARSDKRLGPKLKQSAVDCPAIVAARGPDYRPPTAPPQASDPPSCGIRARVGGGSQVMFIEGQPMSAIAKLLQPRAGRVVVDKTGLTGTWDVELETEVMSVPGIPANTFGEPKEGLSLSTALPEQLGLKLESERGPVDVLVVDSVNLPTPN